MRSAPIRISSLRILLAHGSRFLSDLGESCSNESEDHTQRPPHRNNEDYGQKRAQDQYSADDIEGPAEQDQKDEQRLFALSQLINCVVLFDARYSDDPE